MTLSFTACARRGQTIAFVLSLESFSRRSSVVGASAPHDIAKVVQASLAQALDWPLGAAISVCILLVIISLLCSPSASEKRWSFK